MHNTPLRQADSTALCGNHAYVRHRCCRQPIRSHLSSQNNYANMVVMYAAHQHPLRCKERCATHTYVDCESDRVRASLKTYPCRTSERIVNPKVGLIVSIGSSRRRFNVVVLPALSSPRNRILSSRSLSVENILVLRPLTLVLLQNA